MEAGLYIVATPIGNMADITGRAVEVLGAVSVIACEDTRVTAKLLQRNGLKTPMLRYDEHSAGRARPKIMQRLTAGEAVALVSDAGTPLISDPGYRLVEAALEAGVKVIPVPGASAVLAALAASGLPTDRFLFAGFLPSKQGKRRSELAELAGIPATLVFLESPRRLAASLTDMAEILGPRPAAVARELTKRYEEFRRGGLDELAADYASEDAPKGEIVLVVGPPGDEAPAFDLDAALTDALADHSVREAAALVAAKSGLAKRTVYARALELKAGARTVPGDDV